MATFKDPASDLVTILTSGSLTWMGTSLAGGTNIFSCGEKPASEGFPVAALFVVAYGGPPPSPYFGTAKNAVVDASVQILGRCDVEKEATGRTEMLAVCSFLQQKNVVSSGYVACLLQQPGPNPMPPQDNSYRWTLNVRMVYKG